MTEIRDYTYLRNETRYFKILDPGKSCDDYRKLVPTKMAAHFALPLK